jgi:hypothetical protein
MKEDHMQRRNWVPDVTVIADHGWVTVAASGARNMTMVQAQMRPASGRGFRRGGIKRLAALAVYGICLAGVQLREAHLARQARIDGLRDRCIQQDQLVRQGDPAGTYGLYTPAAAQDWQSN